MKMLAENPKASSVEYFASNDDSNIPKDRAMAPDYTERWQLAWRCGEYKSTMEENGVKR
jgi:hypothetical protein